jgi:hypothetical protein
MTPPSLTHAVTAIALVIAASCVARTPSAETAEAERHPVIEAPRPVGGQPTPQIIVAPAHTPPTPVASTPAPTTPAPATRTSTPTSIPAHGLASLELVCELIAMVAAQDQTGDRYSCYPEKGVFDHDRRAGLLTARAMADYNLPVIASAAGWSVFPPVIYTWGSGSEINLGLREVEFERWPSEVYGELIVIDIEGWTTDGAAEEDHWRRVICAPNQATPRCTSAILYRVERAKVLADGSRKPVSTYEATLRLDGNELVVDTKDAKIERLYDHDATDYLDAGRYPLEQLFATGTKVWQPAL